eukprot:gene9092-6536_t
MPTAKEYLLAQQDCRTMGAELVSITSSQENYALASLISGQTFVGGDQDSEGRWYWKDGQPFTYTNWGYGQPDNTWGYENCLAILPTGLWNDYISPPMAEVFTDSSKGPSASVVVAFADTTLGRGSIELPLVASVPPATVVYAASVPYTATVLPTTVSTTSPTGSRPVTMPTTGPITTYGQPAYVCTVTYV